MLKNKIVYIDMDDVIADFKSAYQKAITETPGIMFPQSQYKFFENLSPIPDSIESVNKLRGRFDVYILTRPSIRNPLCYTEKRIWIEKYFGIDFCDKLILCCHKGLLKGDYLIDDTPWPDFEGRQILFGSRSFKNWHSVLKALDELNDFVGLVYKKARKNLGRHRITKIDGMNVVITDDYDPNRLNFEVTHGVITAVSYG